MDDAAPEVVSPGGDDGEGARDLAEHVIEEALGDDADGILPQAIRSAELRVRLPRHHIDMLEYRADQQQTTVSGVLARASDGIASESKVRSERGVLASPLELAKNSRRARRPAVAGADACAPRRQRPPRLRAKSQPGDEAKTPLGRRLRELRAEIARSGMAPLGWNEIETEVALRRGGWREGSQEK